MKHSLCWLALGLLLGCSETDPATVEDRTAVPTRVISLSPAITETMFALGLGHRLIARSDYDEYPAEALALPTAGTALAPNYEQIARLRPDLVLIEHTQSGYLSELSTLSAVMELPWLSLEDVRRSMLSLGTRFEVSSKAQALASRMDAALTPSDLQPSAQVLLVLDTVFDGGAIWVMKPDSLHGAALRAAGVSNAADQLAGNNASISIEGLLRLNPDALVVMTASTDTSHHEAILDGVRRLTPLHAVRDDRVLLMSGSHVFRTGPSLLQFADELGQLLASAGLVSAAGPTIDG